jgi:hypothetical protein
MPFLKCIDYIESNGRMIVHEKLKIMRKKAVVDYIR